MLCGVVCFHFLRILLKFNRRFEPEKKESLGFSSVFTRSLSDALSCGVKPAGFSLCR